MSLNAIQYFILEYCPTLLPCALWNLHATLKLFSIYFTFLPSYKLCCLPGSLFLLDTSGLMTFLPFIFPVKNLRPEIQIGALCSLKPFVISEYTMYPFILWFLDVPHSPLTCYWIIKFLRTLKEPYIFQSRITWPRHSKPLWLKTRE